MKKIINDPHNVVP
ncbi:Protein of unknown function [Lactobacillus acidophilus DSM 9126]|nr:Protein of unknown function [Lactobacillus acidophilus DSM 9126]